jgi:hypothetical protein
MRKNKNRLFIALALLVFTIAATLASSSGLSSRTLAASAIVCNVIDEDGVVLADPNTYVASVGDAGGSLTIYENPPIADHDAIRVKVLSADNATITFDPPADVDGYSIAEAAQNKMVKVFATKIDPDQPAFFSLTAEIRCISQGCIDFGGTGEPIWIHATTITAHVSCREVPSGCTRTLGYWKNHENEWPVSSLTLGSVTYSKKQLLSILKKPVKGNGLVSLAHQLIAAKLNVAASASAPAAVAAAIAQADATIGGLIVPPVGSGYLAPSATSGLLTTLDVYNNGAAPDGPRHCDD